MSTVNVAKKMTPTARMFSKRMELSRRYGAEFDRLFAEERLPAKQLENFYGRHEDRQRSIIGAMRTGASYSAAYRMSEGSFDTKRWAKLSSRASSCRGLVLWSLCGIVIGSRSGLAPYEGEFRQITTDIDMATRQQMIDLVRHEALAATLKKVNRSRAVSSESGVPNHSTKKVRTDLLTARSKLQKNARDVPRMIDRLKCQPDARLLAVTAIESARILAGVSLIAKALGQNRQEFRGKTCASDPWGIGSDYAQHLHEFSYPSAERRLATHRKLDADAIVSTWIAERFLFPGQRCQIEFVARDFNPSLGSTFDAVLDVGKTHSPEDLTFDHKPPAFDHRDDNCATSLVWEHAIKNGARIKFLKKLVRLVHDGDAATRRNGSLVYKQSRETGLHAIVRHGREYAQSDLMLYRGVALYLDAQYLSKTVFLRGQFGVY